MPQNSRIIEPLHQVQLVHSIQHQSRIAEPCQPWGPNNSFIEDWFDKGEALQYANDFEVKIDEPDRIERAVQWVRDLFNTPRIRPRIA